MFASQFNTELMLYKRDTENINKLGNGLMEMNKCFYNNRTNNPIYKNKTCHFFRRPKDKLYREDKRDRVQMWTATEFQTPPLCFDIFDPMDCHESLKLPKVKLPLRSVEHLTECKGIGASAKWNLSIPDNGTTAYAPAIRHNDPLWPHLKGQTLMANELIIQCPVCSITSMPFRFHNDTSGCYVMQRTEVRGWPSGFEFCDSIAPYANSTDCEEVPYLKIDTSHFNDTAVVVPPSQTTTMHF